MVHSGVMNYKRTNSRSRAINKYKRSFPKSDHKHQQRKLHISVNAPEATKYNDVSHSLSWMLFIVRSLTAVIF